MSDILIRPAESRDIDSLVDGNCRLASETEHLHLDRETVRAGVSAVLTCPERGRYFVAECTGAVVGQVMHTREWSDWRNGDLWWLQSVYVWPEFRRRGVFRGLFRHVQQLAERDPLVVGLRLYVEQENDHARRTYEQLGLSTAGYFVMQQLFGSVPSANTGHSDRPAGQHSQKGLP